MGEEQEPRAAGLAEGSLYYQSNLSYAPEWRRGGGRLYYSKGGEEGGEGAFWWDGCLQVVGRRAQGWMKGLITKIVNTSYASALNMYVCGQLGHGEPENHLEETKTPCGELAIYSSFCVLGNCFNALRLRT